MPAPLLWAALAAAPTAWAGPCVLAESLAEPTRGARPGQPAEVEIRQLHVAETARPDCRALWIPDLPTGRLRSLDARVVRADTRTLRFGSERLSPPRRLDAAPARAAQGRRPRPAPAAHEDGAAPPPPPVLEPAQTTLELRVDRDARPPRSPRDERRLRHAAVRGPGATGAAAVVFPADATERSYTQAGAPGTLLPWGCLLPAAPEGAPVSGPGPGPACARSMRCPAHGRHAHRGRPRRRLHASPAGGATGSPAPASRRAGRQRPAAPHRGGRAPGAADRAAVLSQVAYAAIGASIPEPGLPRLQGAQAEPVHGARVVALVQARAVPGSLPHRGPLSAPPGGDQALGVGHPMEQALLLTRYLRQPADATPVPVRPGRAEGDGVTPTGFTAAVVVLTVDGERTWIDPTCRLCAPGELPPELWDAPALAEGVARTPAAPMGRIDLALDGGALQVALDPAAALAVRRMLLAHPPSERGAALGAAFAGGAALRARGLATPGAPVRPDFDRPPTADGGPPALGDPAADPPRAPWPSTAGPRQPPPRRCDGRRPPPRSRWSVAVVAAGDGPPVLVERVEIPGQPPRLAGSGRRPRGPGRAAAAPHAESPDVPPPPEVSVRRWSVTDAARGDARPPAVPRRPPRRQRPGGADPDRPAGGETAGVNPAQAEAALQTTADATLKVSEQLDFMDQTARPTPWPPGVSGSPVPPTSTPSWWASAARPSTPRASSGGETSRSPRAASPGR